MASCSVAGCTRGVECRGFCGLHYTRWRKHGDPLVVGRSGHPRSFRGGERVGRLVVLDYVPDKWSYRCLCDCGNTSIVQTADLTHGRTQSCGCLRNEMARERATTHGHAQADEGGPTATYRTWQAMRQRCENPRHHKHALYAGRGIKLCERWREFENFLADMGPRPPGTTLDRIDGDGNYEPGNCRWATILVQNRNRRSRTSAARQRSST